MFLDSAVQSIVDGGMLMCTATDMAVLCGNNAEACYSKYVVCTIFVELHNYKCIGCRLYDVVLAHSDRYGSIPLRAKYCHEMALRILLASIEVSSLNYLLI